MAKHITHGKSNKASPKNSKTKDTQQQDAGQQEAQNSFMMPPPVPGMDAPGQDLGMQGPGAGFAPH